MTEGAAGPPPEPWLPSREEQPLSVEAPLGPRRGTLISRHSRDLKDTCSPSQLGSRGESRATRRGVSDSSLDPPENGA